MKIFDKRMPRNVERERYWNEDYVAYWQARVGEANRSDLNTSELVVGDSKTSTDDVYNGAIHLLEVKSTDSVLELGCGFGRSIPLLCKLAGDVTAVDISEQMVNIAKDSFKDRNVQFHVSPSEDLPVPDEAFDIVVCFAAFDAMYQTDALIEMSRVSKKGGRVLLTGKNDNYHDDDDAALAAEKGARAKHHPNYFTDLAKLLDSINLFGFSVQIERFYPRRGDFVRGSFTSKRPEKFYEYLLVLRKTSACAVDASFSISGEVSMTSMRRNTVTS